MSEEEKKANQKKRYLISPKVNFSGPGSMFVGKIYDVTKREHGLMIKSGQGVSVPYSDDVKDLICKRE